MDWQQYVNMIITLQQESITNWKKNDLDLTQKDFLSLVEENHSYNYKLWHMEDKARRDDQGAIFVYNAKRAIDDYNQKRNNYIEAIDSWLYNQLNPAILDQCPLNSETPGMIIDRLSILALKIYHMNLQTKRTDVNIQHQNLCNHKLQILFTQHKQLANCLCLFLQEINNKTRTFVVYHQYKMYNDPTLNPEIQLEMGVAINLEAQA
jgi:hypothetical protein